MGRKEIIQAIAEESGLTQAKAREIVQKVFEGIVQTLVGDGRVELRNFGVFQIKRRAARTGRNPRTGQSVDVPEKFVVTFKPGQNVQQRVAEWRSRKRALIRPERS